MKIIYGKERYRLKNNHPYTKTIAALARIYPGTPGSVPERNDVKQLWKELGDTHRRLLVVVAKQGTGILQSDLETALGVDWKGLRGVHNGLARICERLEVEKPVRVVGYNAGNRRYLMDPDVSATVSGLIN